LGSGSPQTFLELDHETCPNWGTRSLYLYPRVTGSLQSSCRTHRISLQVPQTACATVHTRKATQFCTGQVQTSCGLGILRGANLPRCVSVRLGPNWENVYPQTEGMPQYGHWGGGSHCCHAGCLSMLAAGATDVTLVA
jgi:hypothetical protein